MADGTGIAQQKKYSMCVSFEIMYDSDIIGIELL